MNTGSKKVIYAALLGNAAIMAMKLVAAAYSHSSAMWAEVFHSLADTGNQLLMLLGFFLSQKPPDEKHPFGYGMERFFWAFLVAMSMFTIGATFSIYKGVSRLRAPLPIENAEIGLIVLCAAFVFEAIAWGVAAKEFQRRRGNRGILKAIQDTRDPAVMAVLFEDSAALIGVCIASAGICLSLWTGNTFYDGLASILIGVVLAIVAFFLSLEIRDMLLGESASRQDRAEIRRTLHSFPEVERVLEILTMHIAPDEILLNANIEFQDGLTTERIEKVIDEIEKEIRTKLPQVKKIFIEADTPVETRRVLRPPQSGS